MQHTRIASVMPGAAVFRTPPREVPSDFVVDGPLLGDGDVGVVLSGPPEQLRFHLGKNDFWTRDTRRIRGGPTILTVGGLVLETPALRGASYRVEQDIEHAEVRGRFDGTKAALECAAWMPRLSHLLLCSLRNTGADPVELTARLWAGDPQVGFPDRVERRALIGHSECWLTPCLDRFCGDVRAARIYGACLSPEDVQREAGGAEHGILPLHEFPALSPDQDPLPLAATVPAPSGGCLMLSAWVRLPSDNRRRERQKAVQPHGFTSNYQADAQFLVAKPDVFEFKLLDGVPAMRVGRLCAAADCPLPPGEWRHVAAGFDGRTFVFYVSGRRVATLTPDRVTAGGAAGLCWFRRDADPERPDGMQVAVALAARGGSPRDVNDGLSLHLAPGQACHLLTAVVSNRDATDPVEAASRMAAGGDADRIAALRSAHAVWWRSFWDRSQIDVGDPLIHAFYYGAYYILASCCGDSHTVAPGLFGNWITTDTPAWRGDFHLNYNYEAPWWGAFSGNRVDLAASYDQPILDYVPAARAHARAVGCRGVVYPVGIGPWGLCSDPNFWGQKSNAAYAAGNMIMRWQATQDRDYLREKVYPFVREVVDFWESRLVLAQGRYEIHGDSIHEGSGDDVNPILSLGLVRMALAFLLETSEVLEQDAERRSSWRQILRDLSPFPTQERGGRRVFRLSERGMAWAGCNSLALQHVFPCGCVGLDSPADARDTARETVRQLAVWEDANAFPSFYTQAARVGYDPNAILENLAGQLRSRHALPNLYLSYAGGGIESCGGITGAVNEMLMQSHEGIIRLFPCWPPDRDARFVRLRARGAFLVSAERRHGEVCSVEIQSLAGGRCRLATPFARRDGLRVCEMESRAVVAGPVVAASVLEWSTERGRTYTVDIRQRVQTDRTTQGI